MAALTPVRSIKSALNSRSQEIENQVFLLESMGPSNQKFVILSLVIGNNKYVKTLCLLQFVLKSQGTNNLKSVILSCGYHWFQICQNSWSICFNENTFMAETWWLNMYRPHIHWNSDLFECTKVMQMMSSFCLDFFLFVLTLCPPPPPPPQLVFFKYSSETIGCRKLKLCR